MEELGKVKRTNVDAVADDELREIIPEDVFGVAVGVGIFKENPNGKDVLWPKEGSSLQKILS